jgi:hypothetical protein
MIHFRTVKIFNLLFRVLKSYNLNYHTLPDQKMLVPGTTLTMSSYIGTHFPVSPPDYENVAK